MGLLRSSYDLAMTIAIPVAMTIATQIYSSDVDDAHMFDRDGVHGFFLSEKNVSTMKVEACQAR